MVRTPALRAVLTDAAGTSYQPAGPDARIACFVPSITELIVDLGLANQLVARTQFCIHPADTVSRIPAIGGTKKISLPKVRDLAPTHVILNVDENTREMADALREVVPHVIVTHPIEPEDNMELYRLLGGIFGRETEAEDLVGRFQSAMAVCEDIARDLPPRDVVYFIWKDPWMTVSADTYISRLLSRVGLKTLCHDAGTRYPEVAISKGLIDRADALLFSSEPFDFQPSHLENFARDAGAPPEKLRLVDGEYCSWYGSRAIAGLDYIGGLARELAD